jgi:hypothetical protein
MFLDKQTPLLLESLSRRGGKKGLGENSIECEY